MTARKLTAVVALALVAAGIAAQGPASRADRTPREQAPFDLTGYWVSVVTEDWRWRMVLPGKGDYSSVPLSGEGRSVADQWDPAMLGNDGCKAFGAAAIMRVPGRLRIAWQDDVTLVIETDAGLQTRHLDFDASGETAEERSWQGRSSAEWWAILQPGGLGVSLQTSPPTPGALRVVTTNLRAGYLRRNGVPYSEDAVVTEHFDVISAYGADWLTVLTVVEDPRYLNQPFITSSHFRREPDASNWMPRPCEPAA